MISARTRVVCVIGDPISHSLSPLMHNAAFRHLGLDFVYAAFHVRPSQLKAAVAGFRALQVVGANVTVPHKEKILPLLDSVSLRGQRVGAVNAVANRDGRLHGENTDVFGFQRALEETGATLQDARVVLIGAGGAARAVLVALDDAGAREVRIFNRAPRRAVNLARLVGRRNRSSDRRHRRPNTTAERTRSIETKTVGKLRRGPMNVTTSGFNVLPEIDLADVDIVVNATSIGLQGEAFPRLSYSSAPKRTIFFDLIPRTDTAFLHAAKASGRRTLDGLGMLLHQGAAAFEWWTEEPAPVDVMRRALRAATRA